MAKYNRLGEEVKEVMLDTNIISNLMRFQSPTMKNLMQQSALTNEKHMKHFWETNYLEKAFLQDLEEELFFKAKKVSLSISNVVLREVLNANMAYAKYKDLGQENRKYRDSMVNALRKYDINITQLLQRDKEIFEYIVNLIKGQNPDFPEFNLPAIKLSSVKDILICAHAIIENKPLVTQDNHFVGGNNEHRAEICKRINTAKDKIKQKFGVCLETPKIQTVPEFLKENYSEIHAQYVLTMERAKVMGL